MRIGSQRLTPEIKPGQPAGAPADAPAAQGAGISATLSRDGLTLSGGGAFDSLRESMKHLFDRLMSRFSSHPHPAAPAPTAQPAAPAPAPAPASTGNTMRQQAEALWTQKVDLDPKSFHRGERDFADVNNHDSSLDDKAKRLVAANAATESVRLQALPAAQQSQYAELQQRLVNNPQGQLALQVLLADGKLTAGQPRASNGDDLLTSLSKLGASMTEGHIEPTSLLSDTIQEIAVPSAINQQDKTTCTVTSVEIMTAMENPAEYARIVAGLASPSGKVTLADGQTLNRKPGTERDDDSNRTQSSRLWQAAMVQFALGPSVNYDNRSDTRSDGKWGVFGPELDKVVDALSNRDNPLLEVGDNLSAAQMVDEISCHANAGQPVPVCMDWAAKDASSTKHPGHDVLVTKVTADRVYYNNPWGLQESMSRQEFTERVWWANPVDLSK